MHPGCLLACARSGHRRRRPKADLAASEVTRPELGMSRGERHRPPPPFHSLKKFPRWPLIGYLTGPASCGGILSAPDRPDLGYPFNRS
jgi:hypothetical protein